MVFQIYNKFCSQGESPCWLVNTSTNICVYYFYYQSKMRLQVIIAKFNIVNVNHKEFGKYLLFDQLKFAYTIKK